MTEISLQELFDRLPGAFMPEQARDADVLVQFHLTGQGGGNWWVRIRGPVLTVEQGEQPKPDLVFSASASDALQLYAGKLDPARAYMQGKVHFEGSTSLAMKLARMFRLDELRR